MKCKIQQQQLSKSRRPKGGAIHFVEIEATKMASGIWGLEVKHGTFSNYESLFVYMFRRFGPPMCPGDGYKDLARYVLTTSDPEVTCNIAFLSFGSVRINAYTTKAIEEACHSEMWGNYFEWGFRMKAYFMGKRYRYVTETEVYEQVKFNDSEKEFLEEEYRGYQAENPEISVAAAWKLKWAKQAEMLAQYKAEVEPVPSEKVDPTNVEKYPHYHRVYLAIQDLLTDFLNPVGIRDVSFNCLGNQFSTSIGKVGNDRKVVKAFKYAGYPVIPVKDEMRLFTPTKS